jgi:ABC-type antimicrobial peptide transport system permease subunit
MVQAQALLQDLKFAFRLLRRSPRDTIIAAAIVGLGIGANTAMFSAVNHVLWRPFPFRDEARLIRLREIRAGRDGRLPHRVDRARARQRVVHDDGLLRESGGIDSPALAIAGTLMLATAFIACLLPALAAQRLDPVAALKQE